MFRPFHFRLSNAPGKGRRLSCSRRFCPPPVIRTVSPPTVKKSRGATIRKSASLAICCARVRARSERSPSARACNRQAIRRKRCSRCRDRVSSSNTSRYFPRRAAKLALRRFSISINIALSMSGSFRLTGYCLARTLGDRLGLGGLDGLLRPGETGLEGFQDIGHRGRCPRHRSQLQLVAPDLRVDQGPHALAVVILIISRLEVSGQRLYQQTGQFQFLGCDPLRIRAEFIQRTDFVAVEERVEQQSESAGPQQDQVFAMMHGQLGEGGLGGSTQRFVE